MVQQREREEEESHCEWRSSNVSEERESLNRAVVREGMFSILTGDSSADCGVDWLGGVDGGVNGTSTGSLTGNQKGKEPLSPASPPPCL